MDTVALANEPALMGGSHEYVRLGDTSDRLHLNEMKKHSWDLDLQNQVLHHSIYHLDKDALQDFLIKQDMHYYSIVNDKGDDLARVIIKRGNNGHHQDERYSDFLGTFLENWKTRFANEADFKRELNKVDENGCTLLHFTLFERTGDEVTVDMLVKYGAELTIKNALGQSPLDLMRAHPGHTNLLRKLSDQGLVDIPGYMRSVEPGYAPPSDPLPRKLSDTPVIRRVSDPRRTSDSSLEPPVQPVRVQGRLSEVRPPQRTNTFVEPEARPQSFRIPAPIIADDSPFRDPPRRTSDATRRTSDSSTRAQVGSRDLLVDQKAVVGKMNALRDDGPNVVHPSSLQPNPVVFPPRSGSTRSVQEATRRTSAQRPLVSESSSRPLVSEATRRVSPQVPVVEATRRTSASRPPSVQPPVEAVRQLTSPAPPAQEQPFLPPVREAQMRRASTPHMAILPQGYMVVPPNKKGFEQPTPKRALDEPEDVVMKDHLFTKRRPPPPQKTRSEITTFVGDRGDVKVITGQEVDGLTIRRYAPGTVKEPRSRFSSVSEGKREEEEEKRDERRFQPPPVYLPIPPTHPIRPNVPLSFPPVNAAAPVEEGPAVYQQGPLRYQSGRNSRSALLSGQELWPGEEDPA